MQISSPQFDYKRNGDVSEKNNFELLLFKVLTKRRKALKALENSGLTSDS